MMLERNPSSTVKWAACELYKHYAHEGGARTPLLVHWPRGLKVKACTRSNEPIQVEDVMPTLLLLRARSTPPSATE